jgi:ribosomal protein S18 acetylase RimI-like enzyme
LNLSIQPQYRRCGIATALLEALFRWARKNPIVEKLALAVFTTNVPAIALYKKNGFIEEGRRVKEVKMADGQYVDDILMYKLVKE